MTDYLFNLQQICQSSTQKCLAVYFPDNPPNLTEQWHMVGDENNENYLLKVAHLIIPRSKTDDILPRQEAKHGAFTILGETYNAPPYYIGIKRFDTEAPVRCNKLLNEIISRENIAREAKASGKNYLLAQLSVMSNDEFEKFILPTREKNARKYLETLDAKQAQEKAAQFYLGNATKDRQTQIDFINSVTQISQKWFGNRDQQKNNGPQS